MDCSSCNSHQLWATYLWSDGRQVKARYKCQVCGQGIADEMERQHEDGEECWCLPEVAYVDPESGTKVIVHRRIQ